MTSEMEQRALEGGSISIRKDARKRQNDRAIRMNQPLPNPADVIPGGVDVQYQHDILVIIERLKKQYSWDTATAFRGLNNIVEDVAMVNLS